MSLLTLSTNSVLSYCFRRCIFHDCRILLFMRCRMLSVKLKGLDSVFAFLFTAKVSLVIVINCIWSFLSSTYQQNTSQPACVKEEEVGLKTCDITFSHCPSPAIHWSSCILKLSHHCSLVISLEAGHIFINMSWKQYCNIVRKDPTIFIKLYSLIVGCNAAYCMVFKDLLPWSSGSITGFALIICKYDSATE